MDVMTRRKAIIREYEKGSDREIIASMFQVSTSTVADIVRQFRHEETGLYSHVEEVCGGGYMKKDVRAWSRKQLAKEVETPEGLRTVAAVYPYFMTVMDKTGKKTTFTNQEIYYMNR